MAKPNRTPAEVLALLTEAHDLIELATKSASIACGPPTTDGSLEWTQEQGEAAFGCVDSITEMMEAFKP